MSKRRTAAEHRKRHHRSGDRIQARYRVAAERTKLPATPTADTRIGLDQQFSDWQGMGGGASSLTTNPTMNIADGGGAAGQMLFLIDGSNASNQNGRGLIQQPAIDEIQEFSVQTPICRPSSATAAAR